MGQLVCRLNNVELPRTVVGRATGTSQIVGMFYIQTFTPDENLEIINPSNGITLLTVTSSLPGHLLRSFAMLSLLRSHK